MSLNLMSASYAYDLVNKTRKERIENEQKEAERLLEEMNINKLIHDAARREEWCLRPKPIFPTVGIGIQAQELLSSAGYKVTGTRISMNGDNDQYNLDISWRRNNMRGANENGEDCIN